MPSRREQRRLSRQEQKAVARAQANGECVWNALLASVIGLEAHGPTTHSGLLQVIRHRFAKLTAAGSPVAVKWQGSELTSQEMRECQEAVSNNICIGNGYFCSACDPLLIACAVSFRVNITHSYLDSVLTFEVPGARRHVRLRSVNGHMMHISNDDLKSQEQVSRIQPADKQLERTGTSNSVTYENATPDLQNTAVSVASRTNHGNTSELESTAGSTARRTDHAQTHDLESTAASVAEGASDQGRTVHSSNSQAGRGPGVDLEDNHVQIEGNAHESPEATELTKTERRAAKRELKRSLRRSSAG